ncbi:MAG: bifunctional hydroxymethylpyrimidine kinase/phosphomethylpyrimidine kinase [Proteobacteria bacterium]|nr:bifunctional hydroxymethylpyrimidine kinase/phosphomethylpyrimidine kinase [Pseudomonadota bacterium]
MLNQTFSCLLTIAGHDPSSGAGVSADMAAANALGVSCCSAITALTIQNSQGVTAVHSVMPKVLQSQVEAILSDMPVAAIKIGMIGSRAMVSRLVNMLADVSIPIVLDTVFKASIGENLLDTGARLMFTTRLLPMATLITPNIPEAEQLTGLSICSRADQLAAAQALLSMGAQAVLLKGGHFADALAADLLLTRNKAPVWLVAPSIDSQHSHGSGCVLASNIAAGLVQGLSLLSAVVQAKARVHGGIAHSQKLGKGVGAVATFDWQPSSLHFPWLVEGEQPTSLPTAFPAMLHEIAIYPLVSCADALKPLLAAGCRTLQLRLKSDDCAFVRAQIVRAVALCRDYPDSQLFINDHWQMAIEVGAFGVHLGQEDWQALSFAEQQQLRESGLRLGLSTHNLAEMALAHAARPSYMAIGPLFGTQSKQIAHPAVGLANLRDWLRWLTPTYPVVTIGGIQAQEICQVKACGVNGIAVIAAVDAATDAGVMEKAEQLRALWQTA